MKIFLGSLTSTISVIGLAMALHSLPLFADKQSDDAAEKRRLENEIQEQKIYDRKLEDQQYERRLQDKQREERRQEQKRIDNARQQRRLTGYELAVRDRDRGNNFRNRDEGPDLDDTLDERFLERNRQIPYPNNQRADGCGCQNNPEQRRAVIEQWDMDHQRD